MTREEFEALRNRVKTSGGTLKSFLKAEGIAYSTYNYWLRRTRAEHEPHPMAPVWSGKKGELRKQRSRLRIFTHRLSCKGNFYVFSLFSVPLFIVILLFYNFKVIIGDITIISRLFRMFQ